MTEPADGGFRIDRAGATRPEISVVVPTYNRPELLASCLDSLRRQDLDQRLYEVIVVDDGSPGGAVRALLERLGCDWPGLRTHVSCERRGAGAARNKGVAMASSDVILFTDDDVVGDEDLVRRHLEFHVNAHGERCFVGAVTLDPGLRRTPFIRWLEGESHFTSRWSEEGLVVPPFRSFDTSNLSVPKPLLARAGGFREDLECLEDLELGIRIAELGATLEHRRKPVVRHIRGLEAANFQRRCESFGRSTVVIAHLHPDQGELLLQAVFAPRRTLAVRAFRRLVQPVLPVAAAVTRQSRLWARYFQYRFNRAFLRGADSATRSRSGELSEVPGST